MDRIALDIETIPTVKDPDFSKPGHWTIFAVALGHESVRDDRDVEVLFRLDPTPAAEGALINQSIDWIADRCAGHQRVLITYNGEGYDIPILQHRAATISDVNPGLKVADRLSLLLESSTHADLIQSIRRREGHYVSLDDSLSMFDIDADAPTWRREKVTGADMPEMGLDIVNGDASPELKEVVRRYAASDVKPLFELAREIGEIETCKISRR